MPEKYQHAVVIGAGAYGSAMAHILSSCAHHVTLLTSDESVASNICVEHRNPRLQFEHCFHENVCGSVDDMCLSSCDVIVYASRSSDFAQCYAKVRSISSVPLIATCKGIHDGGKLCSDIAAEIDHVGDRFLYLAGPSFAADIMRDCPIKLEIGCVDALRSSDYAARLSCSTCSVIPYHFTKSIEVAAALKNVLAIVCGMHAHRGDSFVAVTFSDGMKALADILVQFGSNMDYILRYSCLGDVVLTCMNTQSRNARFGRAIAQSLEWGGELVEGAYTAQHVQQFLSRYGLVSDFFEKYCSIITEYTAQLI